MALNKPCVVGAEFLEIPENYSLIQLNATLIEQSNNSVNKLSKINNIVSIFESTIHNVKFNVYAHTINLESMPSYIQKVRGIFMDSMIFQWKQNFISIIQDRIIEAKSLNPDLEIYYRFSREILNNNHYVNIKREIEFVKELISKKTQVNLLVANLESLAECGKFIKIIKNTFNNFQFFKMGIMVENKKIVSELHDILDNKMIDFALVGVNDLMSSFLELDRDSSSNQKIFRFDDEIISKTLKKIKYEFDQYKVPVIIGFPKYDQFEKKL